MAEYLMIESQDPFASRDTEQFYAMAEELAKAGNQVTLFMVQNGVMPVRRCEASHSLQHLADAGVTLKADEFSLRERGISVNQRISDVQAVPLDQVIDAMASGCKMLWH